MGCGSSVSGPSRYADGSCEAASHAAGEIAHHDATPLVAGEATSSRDAAPRASCNHKSKATNNNNNNNKNKATNNNNNYNNNIHINNKSNNNSNDNNNSNNNINNIHIHNHSNNDANNSNNNGNINNNSNNDANNNNTNSNNNNNNSNNNSNNINNNNNNSNNDTNNKHNNSNNKPGDASASHPQGDFRVSAAARSWLSTTDRNADMPLPLSSKAHLPEPVASRVRVDNKLLRSQVSFDAEEDPRPGRPSTLVSQNSNAPVAPSAGRLDLRPAQRKASAVQQEEQFGPWDKEDGDYGPTFGPLQLDGVTLRRLSVLPASYEVAGLYAQTDNCDVHLGLQRQSHQKVIVKRITKAASAQPFRMHVNEVRALRRLQHPCIVKLLGIVDTPLILDMILEYCPAGALRNYPKHGSFQSQHLAQLLFDSASGLAYMHREWFAHLDVKPHNILVSLSEKDASPHGKLCDFGTATRIGASRMLCGQMGTPGYKAPEMEAGLEFDATLADVWSLGKDRWWSLQSSSGDRPSLTSVLRC